MNTPFRIDNPKGNSFDLSGVNYFEYGPGFQNNIELRWSFFSGFYMSLGYLRIEGFKYKIEYDKRVRSIGLNTYNTGLKMVIRRETEAMPEYGAGFNYVTEFGLSFGAGAFIPITFSNKPKVSILVKNADEAILESDLALLKDRIQDEFPEIGLPKIFLSLGYNF